MEESHRLFKNFNKDFVSPIYIKYTSSIIASASHFATEVLACSFLTLPLLYVIS